MNYRINNEKYLWNYQPLTVEARGGVPFSGSPGANMLFNTPPSPLKSVNVCSISIKKLQTQTQEKSGPRADQKTRVSLRGQHGSGWNNCFWWMPL